VQTPILVMGFTELSMHHGALAITRSAGRLGAPVFCVHQSPLARTCVSRYSRGSLPFPVNATDDQRLEVLHRFSRDIGRAVLVPVDDASVLFIDEHAGTLHESFLFPCQPDGLVRRLTSKREMCGLCREHGIPSALSMFPASEAETVSQVERMKFPVMVKRVEAPEPGGPSTPSVLIVRHREELLEAYRQVEVSGRGNVMLQEYIPGGPETSWMFNGYFDSQSECRVAFTGEKLRQSPPHTGAATLGVCLPNPTIENTTRRLMKALGYSGMLDVDYRLDHRDGEYKLLDVNPRIGASFRLFVDTNELDVLRAMYLDLTGQEVPDGGAQRYGRRWIDEPLDLRSSMLYMRDGDLTLGAWARSLWGIEERAWWSREDPFPFLIMLVRLLGMSVCKLLTGQMWLGLGRRLRLQLRGRRT
jgi:predicted ATP-grasp superfamily ATP-dependent carboligase